MWTPSELFQLMKMTQGRNKKYSYLKKIDRLKSPAHHTEGERCFIENVDLGYLHAELIVTK